MEQTSVTVALEDLRATQSLHREGWNPWTNNALRYGCNLPQYRDTITSGMISETDLHTFLHCVQRI